MKLIGIACEHSSSLRLPATSDSRITDPFILPANPLTFPVASWKGRTMLKSAIVWYNLGSVPIRAEANQSIISVTFLLCQLSQALLLNVPDLLDAF